MKKTYIVLALVIALIVGILWYRFGSNTTGTPLINEESTSTVSGTNNTPGTGDNGSTGTAGGPIKVAINPTTKGATYSNFTYGFSVRYPKTVKTEFPFTSFYHLGKDWRAGASAEYRGTPVISFIVYREDNQTVFPKKYPVYFSTEVRVGVTLDTKNCYKTDAGYANQKVTDASFNGITWKKFSFAQSGMMQYSQGESYRTIHGKYCYAVEQVKAGSNYRDNTMATGTSDTTLNNYYLSTTDVLKSFTFTK